MRRALLLAALVPLAAPALTAQVPALPRPGRPIQFTGEIGTFGELYRRGGAPGRRPGETGRLNVNATAKLFGSVTVGVDLIATTEDGASFGASNSLPGRQSISQLGLHPQWSWGRANLGAFSESYSPLTWNGIQVRGAGFDIRPVGLLNVAAFGGRAASPVSGGADNGTFHRTLAGGRLGFGREQLGRPSTFIVLTAMRVWDDPNSLPPVDTTLPPNAPLPGSGTTLVNPYAVTPEENVVLAGTGGLAFFQGKLALRGELAGAVHTRDVRASVLDTAEADIPGVLRGLVTPRVGTHADYALSSEIQLRQLRLPGSAGRAARTLTASLGYRYVGPGYTTLGAASLGTDLQALDARANVRYARWSAQLQAGRQNDNLLGQKSNTTTRYRLGGTFALRMNRAWNTTLRANLLTMGNGSGDTLQWVDYSNWTVGMGHAFSFGPRKRFESLSLDAYYSKAGDANPLRSSTDFMALAASARLAIRLAPDVQLAPTVGLSHSRSDTLAATTRATYGVNAAWRLWKGRLSATGSVGRSTFSATNTWLVTFGSTFRVTDHDDLIFNAQVNRYRDTAVALNGFDEQILNLRWARRF